MEHIIQHNSTYMYIIVCASRIPPRPLEALRLKAGLWEALGKALPLPEGSWHFQMAFVSAIRLLALPAGFWQLRKVLGTSRWPLAFPEGLSYFQRAYSISEGTILLPDGRILKLWSFLCCIWEALGAFLGAVGRFEEA